VTGKLSALSIQASALVEEDDLQLFKPRGLRSTAPGTELQRMLTALIRKLSTDSVPAPLFSTPAAAAVSGVMDCAPRGHPLHC
jgi:hypothetical protein